MPVDSARKPKGQRSIFYTTGNHNKKQILEKSSKTDCFEVVASLQLMAVIYVDNSVCCFFNLLPSDINSLIVVDYRCVYFVLSFCIFAHSIVNWKYTTCTDMNIYLFIHDYRVYQLLRWLCMVVYCRFSSYYRQLAAYSNSYIVLGYQTLYVIILAMKMTCYFIIHLFIAGCFVDIYFKFQVPIR